MCKTTVSTNKALCNRVATAIKKIKFQDFLGHFPGLFKAISTGLKILFSISLFHRRVARYYPWGANPGVQGRIPQPPEANGDRRAKPSAAKARGSGGGAPALGNFTKKITHFLGLNFCFKARSDNSWKRISE